MEQLVKYSEKRGISESYRISRSELCGKEKETAGCWGLFLVQGSYVQTAEKTISIVVATVTEAGDDSGKTRGSEKSSRS